MTHEDEQLFTASVFSLSDPGGDELEVSRNYSNDAIVVRILWTGGRRSYREVVMSPAAASALAAHILSIVGTEAQ